MENEITEKIGQLRGGKGMQTKREWNEMSKTHKKEDKKELIF